jgi:23S rRNA pseudouridine1911/1915/1917 synthase
MKNIEFIIDETSVNTRIDKYLSEKLEDKSRSYLQGIIEADSVKVNNKVIKSNYKLKLYDVVSVSIPELTELKVAAEDIKLNVLYEDSDVIVVNKPQGMVVHPAPGNYNGTLVNALLNHCKDLSGINGVMRPGIVHRIDKDTCGVLVIAKNDNAHNKLSEQLKDHSMTRLYIALVEGRLKNESGTIDAPLGRNANDRIKFAVTSNGKRAVTHYKVIERFDGCTLVQCRLETGRTHQIRVHMAHIGHPLVGDPIYGFKKQKFKLEGQLLHARVLGFKHPSSGEYMEFQAELPEYFLNILNQLQKNN